MYKRGSSEERVENSKEATKNLLGTGIDLNLAIKYLKFIQDDIKKPKKANRKLIFFLPLD